MDASAGQHGKEVHMGTGERRRTTLDMAVRTGRFLARRKRWGIALLFTGPLLLGMGYELFALNLVGLGLAALWLRTQALKRKEQRDHQLLMQRRAERKEWEYQRWLERKERKARRRRR